VSARTAIVVQARMTSSRLPGKVLQLLDDRCVLEHVLTRCATIPGADAVVCAVPDAPESAAIETVAARCGAMTFRGSEHDVLDRYLGAARAARADVVLRVTSDCPLIDPAICGALLALRAARGADYASNVAPRSFPQGLDCEAFTAAALVQAAATATEPYDREHVTPWLRRSPGFVRANLHSGDEHQATQRWTLDYPEDLAFLRAVFAALPPARRTTADVLALVAARPEIAEINAAHRVAPPAKELAAR
jgi:spore coat polysaccharide biosynthesis protein SpsF